MDSALPGMVQWRAVVNSAAKPTFGFCKGAGVAQSVQCLTTDWTSGRSRFDPRKGQMIFPLTSVSSPALGPTQPPVQRVPGGPFPGVKRGRGVTLTTHPHLVQRSRMSRSYILFPQAPPLRVAGLLFSDSVKYGEYAI
jgi:hypothetical protein